jgi:NADH:ubiquinone oxidoreductase subunit 4 (subunit M)
MLLNLVIWIPLAGFVLGMFLPKNNTHLVRIYTLGVSLLTFVLSLALVAMPKDFSYGSTRPISAITWGSMASVCGWCCSPRCSRPSAC